MTKTKASIPLTPPQLAEHAGVGVSTVKRDIKSGKLIASEINSRCRVIEAEEAERYIKLKSKITRQI